MQRPIQGGWGGGNFFFLNVLEETNDSCLTLMISVVYSTNMGTGRIGVLAACTPSHPDCTSTSVARPVARGGGRENQTSPPRWLKVHILRLERYISLKTQAYRMQENCFPEAHDCKISPGEHAPGPQRSSPSGRAPLVPPCLHHDVWKGPFSDKYDPPACKRLATSLLAAMLSVYTCSGTFSTG